MYFYIYIYVYINAQCYNNIVMLMQMYTTIQYTYSYEVCETRDKYNKRGGVQNERIYNDFV